MSHNFVLQVDSLCKKFGTFKAVDNVSFGLKKGEILGFLGPNGAGKTTTIQMLLDILTPTSGTVTYFGKELQANRGEILEKVNFSSTYTELPWRLKVSQILKYSSYFYDIANRKKRVEEVVSIFRLKEIYDQEMSGLSAGQKTRVNLAKAFLNHPEILLLDEPTASLDPESANYIRKFIMEQKRTYNISILFTSHNMAEIEEVCDRVIFLNHGKIVAEDTPENLPKIIKYSTLELRMVDGLNEQLNLVKN